MSKFNSQGEFVFLGTESRTSKAGNEYSRVTLGDQLVLQRLTFFKNDDLDVSQFAEGDKVVATISLEMNGFNLNTNLDSLTPVK